MIMLLIRHKIMADSSATEGRLTRENYANSFNKFCVTWASERKSREKKFLFCAVMNKRSDVKEITRVQGAQKNLLVQIFLGLSLQASFPFCIKQNTCAVTYNPSSRKTEQKKALMAKSLRRKAEGGCEAEYYLPAWLYWKITRNL